jgi:peptidyl-prolyl cis-trans isomerase SurA
MKFLACLTLIAWCLCQGAHAEPKLENAILARVNDTIITFKDVLYRIGSDLDFLARQYATQPQLYEQKEKELKATCIKDLVETQLILHEFKTAGYNLPESWIEDQINKDIRTYGDRLTLTKTLQARGITAEGHRKMIRERIIVDAMWRQNVPRDPVISPHKIESYYADHRSDFKVEDEVKLRMIVVTNQPNDNLFSAKKVAQELRAKIAEGAPFDEMAMVYSQDARRVDGGDRGWIDRSVLRAELAEKAFTLKPGQCSEVIETPDGYYLILVEEARPAHVKPLSEVRDEIESTLKKHENDRLRAKWIDRLMSKSFVRYF